MFLYNFKNNILNRQKMASCLQPRLRNSFFSHEEDSKNKIIVKSQSKPTKGEIEEQLDQCEQIYLAKVREVIEEWKAFNLQNYRIIVSKIDKSLVSEINKVVCEQIKIEKQQIVQQIGLMGKQILQKTQQKSNERTYQAQDHEKTRTLKKQKSYSLLKTRSISGENSKRKISKGNFFAEAKKINLNETTTHEHMVKTNPVSGFYHRNEKEGGKIKKYKKKEDNCFDILKKSNSNTSPSNFMLNYINEKEDSNNNEVNNSSYNFNFPLKKSLKAQLNSKKMQQPPQQIANKTILNTVPQENNMANQSKTYQILMANFQEKITKKLDTLVNKYTIIQEKLQKNYEKSVQKNHLKIPESSFQPPRNNKVSTSIESSLVSSNNDLVNVPEASLVTLRQNSLNQLTLPQASDMSKVYKKCNENQQTKIKQSIEGASKKAIKSIEVSNKIVKNKVKIVQNFQGSIQQIVLSQKQIKICEKAQNIEQKEKKDLENMISCKNIQIEENNKRLQSLINDKTFFERLILSFYAITQQTILPITKDLLYIIVARYEQYCERNNLEKSYQIFSIERGKPQPASQYKKILQKMPKFVELKCDKNKKQKMLAYLEKFVEVICCYCQKENMISKQWKKLVDSQLKQKAQSLIDRIKL